MLKEEEEGEDQSRSGLSIGGCSRIVDNVLATDTTTFGLLLDLVLNGVGVEEEEGVIFTGRRRIELIETPLAKEARRRLQVEILVHSTSSGALGGTLGWGCERDRTPVRFPVVAGVSSALQRDMDSPVSSMSDDAHVSSVCDE